MQACIYVSWCLSPHAWLARAIQAECEPDLGTPLPFSRFSRFRKHEMNCGTSTLLARTHTYRRTHEPHTHTRKHTSTHAPILDRVRARGHTRTCTYCGGG